MTSDDDSVADTPGSLDDTLAPDGSTMVRLGDDVLRRGSALGRYIILRRIGAGAMGAVYEAFDPELERKVALKIMQRGPSSGDGLSEGSARMLREARAMAKLVHPNVITIFDVGTVDGRVFLAMELIEGMTLSEWLAQPRSIPEILKTLGQAGRGLAAAHAAGIVHRDFKPDNVLVGADGRVVVLDFGLAAPTTGRGRGQTTRPRPSLSDRVGEAVVSTGWNDELTATGVIMGTPAYMAPEQHEGQDVDARADQFAFCVTLYEALCGQRPFAGDSLPTLAANVLAGNVRPIPSGHRMPRWVADIVRRGLARQPEDRWPSMDALLAELSRDRVRKRRRMMLAGVAGIALAGTVGGTWVAEQGRIAACEDNEGAFAGVWDDVVRADARRAFERTAGEYGVELFERLDVVLTEYRQTWLQTDRQACIARERWLPLQKACLDEARAQVSALQGIFHDVSREIVDGSVHIAATLPDIQQCAAHEELVQRFPMPPDASSEPAVAEVRRMLAQVEALSRAGVVEGLDETTQTALHRARDIGYEALIAEALAAHGGALAALARFDEAEALYWEAIASAQRARHQRIAAETWNHLVYLVGCEKARPEEVLRWLPVAESAIAVTGSVGLTAAYEGNLGAVLFQKRDYEAAEEHYRKALDLAVSLRGPDHLAVVNYLNNVGTVNAVQGDLETGIEYFERALAIRRSALGEDHLSVAHVLHNLALAHAQLGRPDEALALQKRALAIREQALPPDHGDIASSLNNLAALHYEAERYEEALPLFERALAIQEKLREATHPEVITAHANLATVLLELDRYPEALEHARTVVEAYRTAARTDPERLAAARVESWAGHHADPLADLEEAVAIRRERNASADELATALRLQASAHAGLGDRARAREILQSLLDMPGLSPGVAEEVTGEMRALDEDDRGRRARARR